MTTTPFDPDDDDDAEDIVKVLKKKRRRRLFRRLFFSFLSSPFFGGGGSLENNRARNPHRERISLSPLDVRGVTNSELTDAHSLCVSSAGRTPRRMGTWNRCAIRHR